MARKRCVTWTTIVRDGDGWRGFMRLTGAMEPVICKASTKHEAEMMLVKWLAKRGIPLPEVWNYVES